MRILDEALARRAGVSQNTLEVPHHEVSPQARPRSIEQTAPAIRRHAVGERRGPQVDVSHKRQSYRGGQAGGWRWSGLEKR